ncbi:MAG: glycosyltransferase [Clostridium sp.]|nr:glycosyltransferase [Clostridium sp.]
MAISIICPLYKGEKYIESLDASLRKQIKVDIREIIYIVTKCHEDKSIEKLETINAKYRIIESQDFSHSLTREKAAYEAEGDIIVFITQDIIIKDNMWLYKLTNCLEKGVCEASFSRQICTNKTIERYTRMKNYPDESRVVSKKDLDKLGIMAYFYSDAASAIKKDVFIELNGYDGKDLLTNEDMYIAYKIINNGYRIKYCADAEVIHSHEYSYSSLLKRYFDQGVFLKQHEYISNSGAGSSALNLAKFVVINSLKEKNFKAFFDIVPNFGVRFIANKLGHRYEKLPKEKILKYTSSPNYWERHI